MMDEMQIIKKERTCLNYEIVWESCFTFSCYKHFVYIILMAVGRVASILSVGVGG